MAKDEHKDMKEKIVVKGARTHNLKNVSVEMPRNKMIVFTGLSGSGKSSLAFDTIFAEGQRKYVESLSAYARQFLRQMQKPDVDEISGLSPAISIDQKSRSNNPRSTVATITEIYDYLRVLYSRVGHPHCPECGREVKKLSNEEILETVLKSVASSAKKKEAPAKSDKNLTAEVSAAKVRISAPVVVGRKGEYYQLLYDMLNKGFEKALIDGEEKSLRSRIELKKNFKHDIDIVIDEIFASEFKDDPKGARERASEAIERALHESDGLVKITDASGESRVVSAKFMCAYDGFSFPEVEPRLFRLVGSLAVPVERPLARPDPQDEVLRPEQHVHDAPHPPPAAAATGGVVSRAEPVAAGADRLVGPAGEQRIHELVERDEHLVQPGPSGAHVSAPRTPARRHRAARRSR
jgi:excinuclease ABC subunit A